MSNKFGLFIGKALLVCSYLIAPTAAVITFAILLGMNFPTPFDLYGSIPSDSPLVMLFRNIPRAASFVLPASITVFMLLLISHRLRFGRWFPKNEQGTPAV